MAPSLLSVPALTKKNISVILVPGKALLGDLEDDFSVLGTAVQADDGLLYIPDSEPAASVKMSREEKKKAHAMMAIAYSHAEGVAAFFPESEVRTSTKLTTISRSLELT